jgi:hypothetical protein
MKISNFKIKLLPFHYFGIALVTLSLIELPANAQDFFSGARKNAENVFKDSSSGADLSIVPKVFFGALLLFLFIAAAWLGINAFKEINQGEGSNWAPILYSFISFALLLTFLGFVQKVLFGGGAATAATAAVDAKIFIGFARQAVQVWV